MMSLIDRWDDFWFAEKSTAPLALVRIGFGVMIALWTLSLAPTLLDFFSDQGVLPDRPPQGWTWTILDLLDSSPGLVWACWGLLLAASLTLIAGYRTRVSALVVFVLVLSFQQREVWVFNSGDNVVRLLALFVLVAPTGASFSLDRLRTARDRFWEFPTRPAWGLRLLQVQMSLIYLTAVEEKWRGASWQDGTATSFAFRTDDLKRFPVPSPTDSLLAMNLASYTTLLTELSLGVLVWNRKARPWVLAIGACFHLTIAYSIRIGFFSMAMLVLYLAWVPPERAEALLQAVRDRLSRRTRPGSSGAGPSRPSSAAASSPMSRS